MTRIAQVVDCGAALAWSPISGQADVVALGSKDSGGIGFDDHGGDLDLYDLDIAGGSTSRGPPTPRKVGSVKTTARFSSIAWSPQTFGNAYSMGMIAGGMADGTVRLFDPSRIVSGAAAAADDGCGGQVAVMKNHTGGSVSAVAFSPHLDADTANYLATGATNGEVLIATLDRPDQPDFFNAAGDVGGSSGGGASGGEITSISWNSQVSHIVASSAGDGTCAVWDLRQKKKWCEIRAEQGGIAVSDLAWNPTEGLHILTASGDDRNPVMKLWDLRSSTSMPLATLEGHRGGVLSVAWCPYDASLLLSCGKDNRTLLWDLYTMSPIDELGGNDDDNAVQRGSPTDAGGMYGGSLDASTQRRYDVQWSPVRRGVVSTCSFDRKVEAHSVIGAMNKSGRPPSWLKRSSGVSCGFGGTVLSFGATATATNRAAKIDHNVELPELKRASKEFEHAISSRDYTGFCRNKAEAAAHAGDAHEAQVWGFMQIIFEADARVQILHYLGFDPANISEVAKSYDENHATSSTNGGGGGGQPPVSPMSPNTEEVVKRALLVGDFEGAVDCCFRTGNLADALVLSSCGGADLWAKTQAAYFEQESRKRPFLAVVQAVIHNRLGDLVASSDPANWQETLALLSTYGKSDEFPALCRALGARLEESGDPANASLCYMCALDLANASKYWKRQLVERTGGSDEGSFRTTENVLELHRFVEKVTVFLQAPEVNASLPPDVADLFGSYAKMLAEQGSLETAAGYCRADSVSCNELRDRLYHSSSPGCRQVIGNPPAFPFYRINVGVAPRVATPAAATRAQPQQQQQQRGYQPQQQRQQSVGTTAAAQPAPSNALPPGWAELRDPSSGRTYYANHTTGESAWERPAAPKPAAAPAPAPTPQRQQPMAAASTSSGYGNAYGGGGMQQQHQQQPSSSYQQQQQQPGVVAQQQSYQQPTNAYQPQQTQTPATPSGAGQPTANGGPTTPNTVASKYRDGFVSSSSHPELGQQYGNHGTSNPHMGTRGGMAAVKTPSKAPPSGTYDPGLVNQLPSDQEPVGQALVGIIASLEACPLNMTEKRQLGEIQKAAAILLKKITREGSVEAAAIEQVGAMLTAIQQKQYGVASNIQTGLVNGYWGEHKDWIKGMKFLIQLSMRRLQ